MIMPINAKLSGNSINNARSTTRKTNRRKENKNTTLKIIAAEIANSDTMQ